MQHRQGRITASATKNACHTNPANPAISVINQICYPLLQKKFEKMHTKRGKKDEPIILQSYDNYMKTVLKHEDFALKPSGLWVNPQYPHIGASPAGIAVFVSRHSCSGS